GQHVLPSISPYESTFAAVSCHLAPYRGNPPTSDIRYCFRIFLHNECRAAESRRRHAQLRYHHHISTSEVPPYISRHDFHSGSLFTLPCGRDALLLWRRGEIGLERGKPREILMLML